MVSSTGAGKLRSGVVRKTSGVSGGSIPARFRRVRTPTGCRSRKARQVNSTLHKLQVQALKHGLIVEEALQTHEGTRYYYEVTSKDGGTTEVVQHLIDLPEVIRRMAKGNTHAEAR